MYLDIFKVNNYDCLNIPNLDVTESDWELFGEYTSKPVNTATFNIPDRVSSVTIKLKDEYVNTPTEVAILNKDGAIIHEQTTTDGRIEIREGILLSLNQFHIGVGLYTDESTIYWLNVHVGDYVPSEPKSNAHEYFNEFAIDGLNIINQLGDDTQTVIDFLKRRIEYPISSANYTLFDVANGFKFGKHENFDNENYFLSYINTYDYNDDDGKLTRETFTSTGDGGVSAISNEIEIPYEIGMLESYIVVISSVHFDELVENPSLVDTEFIAAFGTRFVLYGYDDGGDYNTGDGSNPGNIGGGGTWGDSDEEGETWEEGQQFDPNATQSIRVLERETLRQYSIVPDIYNVKIKKEINGPHTLTFNLQPYTNASNIYPPRVMEIDNDFYIVQQIKKRRQISSLEMDIYCEHISYELNEAPSEFFDDNEGKFVWTEDTYRGTASEILREMLSYHPSFFVSRVDREFNDSEYTFKTSSEGFRSRINEFAAHIGAEVEWRKFSISFNRPNTESISLTLEVGKNIIGMTEIIDTTRRGRTVRSYEVDIVDLHHLTDDLDNPLELLDVRLGDMLTLKDKQYGINRTDRVVSIEYDPFNKSLPIIELENGLNSFTNSSDSQGNNGPKMSIDYVIETARAEFSNGLFFQFTRPYSNVFSVTVSLSESDNRVSMLQTLSTTSDSGPLPTVYYDLVARNGNYTGVYVYGNNIDEYIEVSMQAICDPHYYERYE